MKKIQPKANKEKGTIFSIAIGTAVSVLCMLLLSVLLTVLVENEAVSSTMVTIAALCIHAISVFAGSMLSLTGQKGRIAVVAGTVTASYFLMQICVNMLFFSAGFEGVAAGLVSMLVGGVIAVLIKSRLGQKKKYRAKVRSR